MRRSRQASPKPSPTRSTASALGTVLLIGGLAFGAAGCSEAPADGACEKLLNHFIALTVAEGKAAEADEEKFTTALLAETKEGFMERCNRNIKASQIACSLKAKTTKEIDACDS